MFGFQGHNGGATGAGITITSPAPTSSSFSLTGIVTNPGGSASGLTVTVLKNGTSIGTATTASGGTWSFAVTGAANGDVFTATVPITSGSETAVITGSGSVVVNLILLGVL